MGVDSVSVAEEYFARMRDGDLSVTELFHEEAELVGLGMTRRGKAAVADFYRKVIERAGPSPRPAGPLLGNGSRVAAEVFIDLTEEVSVHAVDIFVIEDGLIRSLTYFICQPSG
jgi:hypothetical protein